MSLTSRLSRSWHVLIPLPRSSLWPFPHFFLAFRCESFQSHVLIPTQWSNPFIMSSALAGKLLSQVLVKCTNALKLGFLLPYNLHVTFSLIRHIRLPRNKQGFLEAMTRTRNIYHPTFWLPVKAWENLKDRSGMGVERRNDVLRAGPEDQVKDKSEVCIQTRPSYPQPSLGSPGRHLQDHGSVPLKVFSRLSSNTHQHINKHMLA